MNTFKAYLIELQEELLQLQEASPYDKEFLKRATKIKTFDLRKEDFYTTTYKKEIQFLYATFWFKGDPDKKIPAFDLKQTQKGINIKALNRQIGWLRKNNKFYFETLYKTTPTGIGPGEILLYFLVDDATVGGGSSAGVDIVIIGGKEYELKAAQLSGDKKFVSGFKLGGTGDLAKMQVAAKKLYNRGVKEGIIEKSTGKGSLEISADRIRSLRKAYPKEWAPIDRDYKKMGTKYFGKTNVIFFNNNKSKGKLTAAGGNIIGMKTGIPAKNIEIQAFTSGTIKPIIRL